MIRLEELYLYKPVTNSPFIFEPLNGLDIKMNAAPRVIDTFTLDTAGFFFDITANAKLEIEYERGIDDFYPGTGPGVQAGNESKYTASLELFFTKKNAVNRSALYDFFTFEELVSERWSLIAKYEGTFKAIFLELTANKTTLGNLNQNLVKFTSNEGFGFPYLIENLTVNTIVNNIINC